MNPVWKLRDPADWTDSIDIMVDETFPASDPPSFMGGYDHPEPGAEPRRWLTADHYNYEKFDPEQFDFTHFEGPQVGEAVPDFTLFEAKGMPHTLRDYRGQRVVLETASLTDPFFRAHLDRMNELASTFGAARFLVMYVREAVPGRYIPAITSFAQKWERAQKLQREVGNRREVVIDSVDGRGHQILGSMPNSVYIFEKDGRVGYRAAWTDYETLELALSNLFDHRIPGGSETNCPEPPKLRVVWNTLRQSGSDAMWDVVKASPEIVRTYYKLRNMQHHPPTGSAK